MKHTQFFLGVLAMGLLFSTSCNKKAEEKTNQVPKEIALKIKAQGLSVADIKKTTGGYIVEKDIFISEDKINHSPGLANVPKEEQFRTFALVTGLPRTLTIQLDASINTPFYNKVLDQVISDYNSVGLLLRFAQVATGGNSNITVSFNPFFPQGAALAGFPFDGQPYPKIQMGPSIEGCGFNTAVTVLKHEVGHCIGFRHTDWYARFFSCGAGSGYEGEFWDGVGAVYIPGTPFLDLNSFMLSCYQCGGNRPFTTGDLTALNAMYK